MPIRERLAVLGTQRGLRIARQFANDVREARIGAGLSQADVGRSIGLSKSTVSRFERAQGPWPDMLMAARIARVVGLELTLTCYPAANRLRDAAHVRLVGRFLARLHPRLARALEAPIRPGDQRAWDVLLSADGGRVGVAAETRLRDVQALLRREHLKAVDGGVERLILLVADTQHNRWALAEAGAVILPALPATPRTVLAALGRGELPAASGVVIL